MAAEGTTEWRVDIPDDLFSAVDAICNAYGLKRTKFTEKVFAEVVNKIAHRHMLIARQAKGNALLTEPTAPATDFGGL